MRNSEFPFCCGRFGFSGLAVWRLTPCAAAHSCVQASRGPGHALKIRQEDDSSADGQIPGLGASIAGECWSLTTEYIFGCLGAFVSRCLGRRRASARCCLRVCCLLPTRPRRTWPPCRQVAQCKKRLICRTKMAVFKIAPQGPVQVETRCCAEKPCFSRVWTPTLGPWFYFCCK
jgi:hypothetical protein